MPCYVLQCLECGLVEELILSTPEERPTACRVCHGELKQLFECPPALRFKGPGFYVNDYGKGKGVSNNEV